jgi:glycosyltransferase involved in cell wall biosynthesis
MLFSLTLPRKIVVVMPAYNAAKTLKITYDDLPHGEIGEVILVDDASRDETVRVAKDLGLTVFVHLRNYGYVFDRARIIDTVGLVSPEAIPYLLKERAPGQDFNYAISPEVMTTLQPDYLITLEIFARPTLLQSPEFLQNYRLVQTYTASDFNSRACWCLSVAQRQTDNARHDHKIFYASK